MVFTPSPVEPEPRVGSPAQSLGNAATGADAMASETLASGAAGVAGSGAPTAAEAESERVSTAVLIEQLQADRLWLLRQIDGGAYPDLRLDLAALERELGQLLDQAGERVAGT